MSRFSKRFGTATTTDATSIYPDQLDSDDPATIVACIEREYDCEEVRVDEEFAETFLIIRSNSQYSVPATLLRHLQAAGFDIGTITTQVRDGSFCLEVGVWQ